jgi:hypothetical protein
MPKRLDVGEDFQKKKPSRICFATKCLSLPLAEDWTNSFTKTLKGFWNELVFVEAIQCY